MKTRYLPFILASLLIFVLSIVAIFKPKTDYLQTTGIIKHIEEEYDYEQEEYTYIVYIDYSVNDKNYVDIIYPSYDSSMKINDEVKVYYDPSDPSTIQAEGYQIVPYITLGVSLIVLTVCTIKMTKH
ncbi:MAG: hypothetical protein Q4E33_02615 [Erysipelotrichaceae bacterium]|nr:hypothetical protein [Erysipelotrichaceae bacterium]